MNWNRLIKAVGVALSIFQISIYVTLSIFLLVGLITFGVFSLINSASPLIGIAIILGTVFVLVTAYVYPMMSL